MLALHIFAGRFRRRRPFRIQPLRRTCEGLSFRVDRPGERLDIRDGFA